MPGNFEIRLFTVTAAKNYHQRSRTVNNHVYVMTYENVKEQFPQTLRGNSSGNGAQTHVRIPSSQ